MESVLGRYRNLIILVGVLFLQVLGLAMQVKKTSAKEDKDTRLIRIWAVGALAPFERGVVWIHNSTHSVWHNYFYLRGVRAENRELKQQIEQMRIEQVRLSEDASQARRLQNLLSFKEQFISKTVAAQVIGTSGSDLSRVVYIDKGENAGIKRDMAVITAEGIVGKVLLVYPSESQVLLINDQSSGVGAILEKSRLQGVLKGSAGGEVMLERVMADEDVHVGETVLTSGGDQIFPKGLPVGTVAQVEKGKELFLDIKIKPAASLGRLEEVLVLVEKQDKQAIADSTVPVRAADILAQRLPSVPDKPVADANSIEKPGEGTAKPGTAASATTAKPPVKAASTGSPKPQSATSTPQVTGNKLAGQSATAIPKQKAPDVSTTNAKPNAEVPKPAVKTPKPATPAAAQTNSQPIAEDNSPH